MCHFKKIADLKDIMKDIEDLKKEMKAPSGKHIPKSSVPSPSQARDMSDSNSDLPDSESPAPKMNEGLSAPSGEEKGKRERELDIALKDPSVKSFMDTFKARVLSVKPIERAEKKE